MDRRNDFVLYSVSAILLIGAASIWWQGIRPSPSGRVSPIPAAQAAKDARDQSATSAAPDSVPGEPGRSSGGGESAGSASSGAGEAAVFVHVAGAVKASGVYRLKEGQRLYEAVALAGPDEDADLDALNLASVLRDSQKVYVPRKGESSPWLTAADTGLSGVAGAGAIVFPLDINTATARELEELPGIGPVLASAIVARRTEFGPFDRPEDIQDVPGIGEKTYARIAHLVTVK